MSSNILRVFLSYSRADNQPGAAGEPGWADALYQFLLGQAEVPGQPALQLFLDREDIRDHDDWRDRIDEKLRDADVLLVLLSPNYFASRYCREEWQSFCGRRGSRGLGGEGAAIAAVTLAPIPAAAVAGEARWYDSVRSSNPIDFSTWSGVGSGVLTGSPAAALQAQRLLQALRARAVRLTRTRSARRGNMLEATEHFVGRVDQLRQIHRALTRGTVGAVTALHGLGGIGKTELALHYAHEYAYAYPGGCWLLDAYEASDLRELIARLADQRGFPQQPTEAQRASPQALFDFVLQTLHEVAERGSDGDADGGQVLLVLDNVTRPALLDASQRQLLPRHPWLAVLATSREEFPGWKRAHRLTSIALEPLSPGDAMTLIREWQPGHVFRSDDDAAAATVLVQELGGYTLAVKQAAAYLGLHESVSVRQLLDRLDAAGLRELDAIVAADADAVGEIAHRSARLDLILEETLPRAGSLERELLDHAALWAPESIPRAWINEWAQRARPGSGQERAVMDTALEKAWATLVGLHLLSRGNSTELRRMHALIRAHLLAQTTAELPPAFDTDLDRHIAALEADFTHNSVREWQLTALFDLVRYRLQPPLMAVVWQGHALVRIVLERRGPSAVGDVAVRLLGCAEQIAGANPSFDAQRALSASLNQVGAIRAQQGDMRGSLQAYERSLAIREAQQRDHPDSTQARRDLAVVLNRLGDVHAQRGDAAAALQVYQRSLAMREVAAERDPANAQTERDIAAGFHRVGDIHAQQGDLAAASQSFQRSLTIFEAQAQRDPGDAQAQRAVAATCSRLGDLCVRLGDVGAALHWFQRGLALLEPLADGDASNEQAQRDVSTALERMGDIHLLRGDAVAALQAYRDSLAVYEALLQRDPDNVQVQRGLSVSLGKVGDVQMKQGDLGAALQVYQRSLALREALAQRDSGNAQARRDLSVALNKLGDVHAEQGHAAWALPLHRRSLSIRETLAEQDSSNAQAQRDVAVSWSKVGDMLAQQRDLAQALQAYQSSLQIREDLAQRDPDNAQAQRDLWVGHFKLFELLNVLIGPVVALNHLQAVDRILTAMDARGMHLSPADRQVWRQVRSQLPPSSA